MQLNFLFKYLTETTPQALVETQHVQDGDSGS